MLNTSKQPLFMLLLYLLFTYLELIVDVAPLQLLVEPVVDSCRIELLLN